MSKVSQRIKEMRIEKRLTQAELSQGIITRSYLSQIERGSITPSYEVVRKLAEKLDCNINDLLYQQPKNKDLIKIQIQKDIKLAENSVQESNFKKAQKLINNEFFNDYKEYIEKEEWGVLYWIRGKISQHKNHFSQAISHYEESIRELEKTNSEKTVRTLSDLGYTYSLIDKNIKALNALSKANRLSIYENISNQIRISLLLNLGIVHGKLNESHSAINFLEEAAELNHSLKIFYKSGEINMALGICYMQLGKTGNSKESFLKAIDFFSMTNESDKLAGTLNNLAIILREIGNKEEAIKKFQEAKEIFDKINDFNNKINVELELAETYLQLANYQKTSHICNGILKGKDKLYFSKCYEILGDVEKEKQNYSLALHFYNGALGCMDKTREKVVNNKKAITYFLLKKYKMSSTLFIENADI